MKLRACCWGKLWKSDCIRSDLWQFEMNDEECGLGGVVKFSSGGEQQLEVSFEER